MHSRRVVAIVEGRGLAEPHGAAVSSDGRYLYVSNNNLKGVYQPHGADGVGTVVVINTATRQIEKVIEVGHYPAGVATLVAN